MNITTLMGRVHEIQAPDKNHRWICVRMQRPSVVPEDFTGAKHTQIWVRTSMDFEGVESLQQGDTVLVEGTMYNPNTSEQIYVYAEALKVISNDDRISGERRGHSSGPQAVAESITGLKGFNAYIDYSAGSNSTTPGQWTLGGVTRTTGGRFQLYPSYTLRGSETGRIRMEDGRGIDP